MTLFVSRKCFIVITNRFLNERIPCGDNDRNSGESERRSPKEPLLILLSPALCNANDKIIISNTLMFCFAFYHIYKRFIEIFKTYQSCIIYNSSFMPCIVNE